MKNIYLLSFTGGTGGDFLCSQISKDNNFYLLESKMDPSTNTCNLENPFEKWNLDIKNNFKAPISDSLFEEINLYYNKKNIITPTHFFGNVNQIKLPRIKGIKLYSNLFFPYFYLLLWIKRWVFKRHFENKEDAHEIFKSLNPNSDNTTFNKDIIDRIVENRNYFYSYEIAALKTFHMNAIDFVVNGFNFHKRYSSRTYEDLGWIPYNIDNLYLDPVNNVKEFSQLFNMEESINSEIIAEYYSQNLKVIEETFGEPYETFISSDWLSKLKEWVCEQCPNSYSYSISFKIF
jgi:hypothetical protein